MNNKFLSRIGALTLSAIMVANIPAFGYFFSHAQEESERKYFSIEDLSEEDFNISSLKDGMLPYLDMKLGEKTDKDLENYTVVEVASKDDLVKLAENCVLDEWSRDIYVKLTADISLVGIQNFSIPTFGGIFDGEGHSITGLVIDGNGSSLGLFRYIQAGGEVKNLSVTGNVTPSMSSCQLGIIAGTNYGEIRDCVVKGVVVGDTEIAGVAGYNAESGEIISCNTNAYVTGKHSTGGIAGLNEGTIIDCENNGGINLTVSDIKVDISELTIERLQAINSTSNTAVFTDIGGIAGVSSGTICRGVNNSKIGYAHVGYNIGGIVGRLSQGYLSNCTNNGSILGRKDVGGIAGQMEPFLQVEYMLDGITQLDNAVNALFDMTDETISDGERYSKEASDLLSEISDAIFEANNISKDVPTSKEDIKNQKDNLLSVKEDMDIIAEYSEKFSDLIDNSSDELSNDLKALTTQGRKVYNLASAIRNSILSYQGITVSDGSDIEAELTEEELEFENFGRLTDSVNYGKIEADSAVGGIVGRVSTEYDFDLEDDIDITGSESLYVNATAKAIIKDNKSEGQILGKKDYVGGIAGYAQYGYLISNISVSKVSSENGNYVGGIAGESDNNIMLCYSCSDIAGKSYVGGIAGKGNKISGSASFSELDYTGEKAGMIAGEIAGDGEIYLNYYVDSKIGGIDGIGYTNGAAPLSYEEFCKIPNLPEEFSVFDIVFVADGEEIGRIKAKYNDKIDEKDIPQIPEKEGYFGVWPEYDFSSVCGSRVLEVIYEKWEKSVQSKETIKIDDVERPLILVGGEFLPGAELTIEHNGDEYYLSVSYGEDATTAREMGIIDFSGEAQIRIATEETDNNIVEVFDGNNWNKVSSDALGSYITFNAELPCKFRVTHVANYAFWIKICIAVAIAVGIAVCIILVNRVKKIKKKLALKRPPKAVIFDLDGTLIDTERYYRKVWPQALEHFGYHPSDKQILELRSLGRPFAPKKLKEWFGDDFDYDTVREYRKQLFDECVKRDGIKLKPGVLQLLEYLKEKGIIIAIATATDGKRTAQYLEMAGISDYVDIICSAANVKEGKPSPDVYIQACKQLKLAPEYCFAVEDSPNGIKSAYSAGLRVIFVPDQTKDEPEAEKLTFAKVNTADEIIKICDLK